LSDFTTASKTAWGSPAVRFISINVTELDAFKQAALPLVGDARVSLEELQAALGAWQVAPKYGAEAHSLKQAWEEETDRVFELNHGPTISQGEVIGILNEFSGEDAVVVCAAGSLPGDLHKLWRTKRSGGYHLEYGYSCMGYEIAGGLGVKLAQPDRDVYVMVGDGSYLMMAQEIVTAVQEGVSITILLLDNHGFSSIGDLSASVGCDGFGTRYQRRSPSGELDAELIDVDFVANAASMGAHAVMAASRDEIRSALEDARSRQGVNVIVIPVDREQRVPGYESWWDVPVAEASPLPDVQRARSTYDRARKKVRQYL
jgi:3D-(3,5/4)-trihydroxycyclohexane-1,2-dione acylhydrolase (decyclizing)